MFLNWPPVFLLAAAGKAVILALVKEQGLLDFVAVDFAVVAAAAAAAAAVKVIISTMTCFSPQYYLTIIIPRT